MDRDTEEAFRQVELAEAELAVLKQELVLQHLLDTRKPSAEAASQLARLREVVARLLEKTGPHQFNDAA